MLLPARNAAATLGRALAGIRGQTWTDWELVLVDDGSTDGTLELAREEARGDPRIRVLPRPPEGLVAALNAGLEYARGEYVARMDADDEAHPERLAEQLRLLEERPELGLAGCLVEFAGDARAGAGYALHVDWLNSLVTPEAIALNRFVESPLAHPSVMFRRALVARHGGYRAGGFPEDYELWLRWLDAGVQMAKVPRVLLRWHDSPGRLSRADARYDPEAFFQLKAEWIARWLRASGVVAGRRILAQVAGGSGTAESGRTLAHGELSGEGAARPVLVWGAGRPTRKRAAHLERHGIRIAGYVDIDPRKTTPALGGTGVPVIAPGALPEPGRAFVLGYVAARGARDLIRPQLAARGYVEGRDFLMCA